MNTTVLDLALDVLVVVGNIIVGTIVIFYICYGLSKVIEFLKKRKKKRYQIVFIRFPEQDVEEGTDCPITTFIHNNINSKEKFIVARSLEECMGKFYNGLDSYKIMIASVKELNFE